MDEFYPIYYNVSCLYSGINWRSVPVKIRLAALLLIITLLLTACSYWVVEEAPVQVGQSTIQSE